MTGVAYVLPSDMLRRYLKWALTLCPCGNGQRIEVRGKCRKCYNVEMRRKRRRSERGGGR